MELTLAPIFCIYKRFFHSVTLSAFPWRNGGSAGLTEAFVSRDDDGHPPPSHPPRHSIKISLNEEKPVD